MRTIVLHGLAAERFGPEFRMDVASLGEACRALGSQLRGFRQFLIAHDFKVMLRNSKGAMHLNDQVIGMRLPEGDLHVVPYVQGAKNSGLGKLIAGVLIASIAWYAPIGLGLTGGLGASLVGGITYGNVAILGVGLAFVGLSQLLTKKPNSPQDEQSFVLNGAQNSIQQGVGVTLIYGQYRVGSTVISSFYDASLIPEGYIPGSYADRNVEKAN